MSSKKMRLVESAVKKIVMKNLNEASEVQLSELPKPQQQIAKKLESIMGIPIAQYFDGIHGYVVTFKKSGMYSAGRLEINIVKKLANAPIRWIEYSFDAWSIGF